MTVLFKLKTEVKTQSYFNKFIYKLKFSYPNLRYTRDVKTFDGYLGEIKSCFMRSVSMAWYSGPENLTHKQESKIKHFINFRQKYIKDKENVRFRQEGDRIAIYANDINILKEVCKFMPDAVLYKADVSPDGIKYFVNDPPAKFRVHMRNKEIKGEFKDDFSEYLSRTPDLKPNSCLRRFLKSQNYYIWLSETNYLDCNEEANILMLRLMFPNEVGKVYKLEKKQG